MNERGNAGDPWRHVGDHIVSNPDSVCAKTLTSPLMLSLARDAYRGGDPRELLSAFEDSAELEVHLISRVFEKAYADDSERAKAQYWLGWVALRMLTEGPDILWWQVPVWLDSKIKRIRRISRRAVTFISVSVSGTAIGVSNGSVLAGLLAGLACACLFLLVDTEADYGSLRRSFVFSLGRLRLVALLWELPMGALLGIVVGAIVGAASGLSVLLVVDLDRAIEVAVGIGICFAVWVSIIYPLDEVSKTPVESQARATPHAMYKEDFRNQVWISVISSSVAGLTCYLVALVMSSSATFPVVAAGIVVTCTLILLVLANSDPNPSFALLVDQILLAMGGWGRIDFSEVLRDAHQRHLLRSAGTAYQFRHSALQDYLARHYIATQLQR
jgi:hypothetical protein